MDTTDIKKEIAAFERQLPVLLEHHLGKYVVFHDEKFVGAFDTFDNAAAEAVRKFGLGPYLIRQVLKERPVFVVPASVAYRPVHAVA